MGNNKRNTRVIRLSRPYYCLKSHFGHLRCNINTILSQIKWTYSGFFSFPSCYIDIYNYTHVRRIQGSKPTDLGGTYPNQNHITAFIRRNTYSRKGVLLTISLVPDTPFIVMCRPLMAGIRRNLLLVATKLSLRPNASLFINFQRITPLLDRSLNQTGTLSRKYYGKYPQGLSIININYYSEYCTIKKT